MPDPDPYAPFDRCGWTVHRLQSVFPDHPDYPDRVRVARGGYAEYLVASFYDALEGDDIAFAGIMEAHREDYIRTNLLADLPVDATITIEPGEQEGTTIVRAEWMES